MSEIVSFTGGKRCKDCGEQITPTRLKSVPDTSRCSECQREREAEIKRARLFARPRDIEIIRG